MKETQRESRGEKIKKGGKEGGKKKRKGTERERERIVGRRLGRGILQLQLSQKAYCGERYKKMVCFVFLFTIDFFVFLSLYQFDWRPFLTDLLLLLLLLLLCFLLLMDI